MKRLMICCCVCLLFNRGILSQDVARIDPYDIRYEPGVILVKFGEKMDIPLSKDGRLGRVSPSGIQVLLSKYGIQEGERLFPESRRGESLQKVRTFGGEEHEAGTLYNIFRFRFDYIFVPSSVQVRDTKIIQLQRENCFPSDHFPLLSRLVLSTVQPSLPSSLGK